MEDFIRKLTSPSKGREDRNFYTVFIRIFYIIINKCIHTEEYSIPILMKNIIR